MEKFLSITLKLPESIHTKLKVASALSGKSMTQIIIDHVERLKVETPDFMQPGEKKKTVKDEIKKTVSADEEEIKKSILAWKEEGVTYQGIADRFTEQGTPTLSGRGGWNKGSVSNLLKKWGVKQTIKT